MRISWLIIIFALLSTIAPSAIRAQDTVVWNLQLPAERKGQTTVGVSNRCQAAHEFELSADAGIPWFAFTEPPRLRVAPQETREVAAEINTAGLDIGAYQGRILVRCTDCGVQECENRNITVHLKVIWATADIARLQPDQFVAGQIVVVLKLDDDRHFERTMRELETAHDIRRIKVFRLSSIQQAAVLFALLSQQDSVAVAIARMQNESRVLYAQPNFKYRAQAVSSSSPYNDPLSSLQYGARQMRAEQLHKLSTGRGVKVALIDTGVDYDHSDLKGRVVDRANFVEDDKSFKTDVHGTLVAGVIAARPNNGIGIYGVAPGVSLIAIKSLKPRQSNSLVADGSSHTVAQGLEYAISNGARIINLSIGGPREPLVTRLTRAAIARGITVVAAVGNDGKDAQPKYPAALEEVLAVTSVDSRDQLYSLASRGDYVDVAAPGVEIVSTAPGNKFNTFSGTSMAAPHVTALVALLLQSNPSLTPGEIKTVLEKTARDLGPVGRDKDSGSGVVDACGAFQRATNKKVCE